jgi:hypothetical protein
MSRTIVAVTLQGANMGDSATITETGGPIVPRVIGVSRAGLMEDHPRWS